ncbi:hypothetical protein COV23_01425 [Candidatus Wolfebacteria bacterium CG10_big_fil_rev_8_21_14_0_10_31_9]|uniref:Uncharacterized protein n=1 Tax=Candidatus Wolfebacteria bacterium CG10_big_fil_rev_8_21_14_0_10_31_9 TaxID=1975070 RepID=A0A2H0RCM5_9BACT|nr:MAG: hypothetical protein COV23_01425 [Candidatus Wolfebacteria bacterium CG10_big_fil_rev_8_21_14_0_10_31_9]
MVKKVVKFFDKLEDKIRTKLSKKPIVYAFVGSVGIILLWRGVWHFADDIGMGSITSLIIGVIILLLIGLFVSFFVGEQTIISGIKKEKRIDEKTEKEIKDEAFTLKEIHQDVEELKEELKHIEKEIENDI